MSSLPSGETKMMVRMSQYSVVLDAVLLPSIQPSEPVNSIRAALSEVRGYAHLTNFRLVAEDMREGLLTEIMEKSSLVKGNSSAPSSSGGAHGGGGTNNRQAATSVKKKKKKSKGSNNNNNNSNNNQKATSNAHNVVSPYTLKNAVVKVPASNLSLEADPTITSTREKEPVLDDYGDLTPLVSSGTIESNKTGFRVVLEQYNAGSVKDHVKRVRALLEGNIPLVDSLTNGEQPNNDNASKQADGGEADVEGSTVRFISFLVFLTPLRITLRITLISPPHNLYFMYCRTPNRKMKARKQSRKIKVKRKKANGKTKNQTLNCRM